MPNAILVQVASEVTDALNNAAAGTFNHDFEAVRGYADWDLPLEETAPNDRVIVDVVPVPQLPTELETRGSVNYEPSVDIIIRRRITQDQRNQDGTLNLAVIDALVLFVQQISEYFITDQLATSQARWKETEIRRSHIPIHLEKFSQFTGIVRITFDMPNSL